MKEKIIGWLKEEACLPTENKDPNAFFNISAKMGNASCNVVQDAPRPDSIFVFVNLLLTKEQLDLFRKIMNVEKRQNYFWNLRLALASNAGIGFFEIRPTPPENIESIFIASRRLYYDSLTKEKIMNAMISVLTAAHISIWMMEQHAGKLALGNNPNPTITVESAS